MAEFNHETGEVSFHIDPDDKEEYNDLEIGDISMGDGEWWIARSESYPGLAWIARTPELACAGLVNIRKIVRAK